MFLRPSAKNKRLAATKFPLKHLKSDSSAAARITFTIQCEPTACWNATAVINFSPVSLLQGAANATAATMTAQKTNPTITAVQIARRNVEDRNSGLASSAALPTDSNPVIKYGTIWITSTTDRSGECVNKDGKCDADPRLAPRATKITNKPSVPKLVQF